MAGYFNMDSDCYTRARAHTHSLFIHTPTKIERKKLVTCCSLPKRHRVPTGQEHIFLPPSHGNSCSLSFSRWQRSQSVAHFPCRFLCTKGKEMADVIGCGERRLIFFYFTFSSVHLSAIYFGLL